MLVQLVQVLLVPQHQSQQQPQQLVEHSDMVALQMELVVLNPQQHAQLMQESK